MGHSAATRKSGAEPVDQADCLFCQVHDPSVNDLVTESPNFYVRWDNFPASKGHVEVVPKRHVVSYFDLTEDEAAEVHELMQRTHRMLDEDFHPDGYTIGINDGRAAGRTVDHLHIHVIPRYDGDVADPRGGVRHVLPGTDPDAWSVRA